MDPRPHWTKQGVKFTTLHFNFHFLLLNSLTQIFPEIFGCEQPPSNLAQHNYSSQMLLVNMNSISDPQWSLAHRSDPSQYLQPCWIRLYWWPCLTMEISTNKYRMVTCMIKFMHMEKSCNFRPFKFQVHYTSWVTLDV